MDGRCAKTPSQFVYDTAEQFNEMRALRNHDGSWMRLYCRETRQKGDYLTSISVIGEALLERALKIGVEGMEDWRGFEMGSVCWSFNG